MTHNPMPMGEPNKLHTENENFADQVPEYEVDPSEAHASALDDLAAQLGGGGFDMSGLLAQAQAMQAQFEAAQEQISKTQVTGTSGGGLVSVTMVGNGEVTAIEIKPEACDPSDTESLGDLIVAALRDARVQVDTLTQDTMGPLAGGFGM